MKSSDVATVSTELCLSQLSQTSARSRTGWLSEEAVLAHYHGNKEKAGRAMSEAEQAGRRMDDPNCSNAFLYQLVTELSELDLKRKTEEWKSKVVPLSRDPRPEAQKLFAELKNGGVEQPQLTDGGAPAPVPAPKAKAKAKSKPASSSQRSSLSWTGKPRRRPLRRRFLQRLAALPA
ncbi:unnamed protein product [Effrenium voratum]|nr:unnamed protein product [Effrenium voratum]CAJ1356778.1 unnamed protein product [Effrenium voratum]CAJ1422497.1 unnamed protein product [Effrenium voratum]